MAGSVTPADKRGKRATFSMEHGTERGTMTAATLRNRLWLWGHQAGSHNGQFGLQGVSRVTPAEAAADFGIPNLIMVVYGNEPSPPFAPHARPMQALDRLVWSIVGDSGSTRNDARSDLDAVLALAGSCPNVCGAIMDDFFVDKPGPHGAQARHPPEDVAAFARRLHAAPRPLELWVVMYAHHLGRPVGEHLRHCDAVTFWTWQARELDRLEENFARLEAAAPAARKLLGCYMWDYGCRDGGRPMPLDRMQRQCARGLEWLKTGRIDGMIFLASCIADLDLEAVNWTRDWIREVGDEPA
jgi:hypothetical protein